MVAVPVLKAFLSFDQSWFAEKLTVLAFPLLLVLVMWMGFP
jgi:hypothetical protein